MIQDPNKTNPLRYPGVYIAQNNIRYILDREGLLYTSEREPIAKPEMVGFFPSPPHSVQERTPNREVLEQIITAINLNNSEELKKLIMKYGTRPHINTRLVAYFPKEANRKGLISIPITKILKI